jgi:hypothetical protein
MNGGAGFPSGSNAQGHNSALLCHFLITISSATGMMNGGAGFHAQGQNMQGMQNTYGFPSGQGPYQQGTFPPCSGFSVR